MLQICRDYSTKRIAFGKYLYEHPLHIRILSRMEVVHYHCVWWWGGGGGGGGGEFEILCTGYLLILLASCM